MKSCLLFAAILFSPPVHGDTPALPAKSTPSATSVVTLRLVDDASIKNNGGKSNLATRDELRAVYRELLAKTSRRKQPNPYTFSEPLVALHRAIASCRKMSNNEKKRLHRSVEGRLEQFVVLLKRDMRRTKNTASKLPSKTPSIRQPFTGKTSLSGGAGVARSAAELIHLIQSTIEPDSWDVNGGKGSIMFYSRLNVLVIRNTSEVHHSVGTGLTKLRSMQPPMVSVTTGLQAIND